MSTPDARAAAVALAAIRAAFPRRPLAPETPIASPGLWFDEAGRAHTYDDPEAAEVARFFSGKSWWDVPGEALLHWSHMDVALACLTPRARAYFLPTYMTAVLTIPLDPVTFGALDSTVHALTAPPPEADAAHPRRPDLRTGSQKQEMARERARSFQAFADALDAKQRAAVVAFLDAVEPLFEDPDLGPNAVTTALGRFWRRDRPAP